MNRNLTVLLCTAAFALSVTGTSLASQHASKKAGAARALPASAAACAVSDPSACPASCPISCGSKVTAATHVIMSGVSATAAAVAPARSASDTRAFSKNGAACPDPSACPACCRRASASSVAAVTERH